MRDPQPGKQWDADMDPDAPDGFVWECQACGKQVKNIFSEKGGFDESCVLNSLLTRESNG